MCCLDSGVWLSDLRFRSEVSLSFLILARLNKSVTEPMDISTIISCLSILPLLILISHFRSHHQNGRPRGCRKLGLSPSQSNLNDEYDPQYTQGVYGQASWCIKALFTYPIKSCAGVELGVADVVPTGLAYDRQFCFAECVQSSEGEMQWTAKTLRDRRFNRMALVRPEIWVPDPLATDYASDLVEVKSEGVMVVSFSRVVPNGTVHPLLVNLGMVLGIIPREYSFTVPLSPPPDRMALYPSIPVKIWKDCPVAYDYGQHIPKSLRAYLGSGSDDSNTRLSLFRVNPSHHREIFRCAPSKDELGYQTTTGFADAYPIHLLNLASVRDVATRCAADIPRLSIRRFRANIIMQGPGAFAEDHWKRIVVGDDRDSGVEIHTVCRTVRCRLPNVDPDTGIRHPSEPDRTLKSYRRIDRGDLTNACLGMQLVPAAQSELPLLFSHSDSC